ncbi:hypothetical protein E0Z10_g7200 [Xylaria hypoxylon]|uniref:Uncharacterized protein n=1 Tax=Xylaria hypoxylon TaxID=37992 RepID=A0A4Z0YBF4_9PEZI|nr:hypothetical protein E0Z10_g7200 [Xylaria hypoxylon]
MTSLPLLTDQPTRHPGCCLSLSLPLLDTIRVLLGSIPVITQSTDVTTNRKSRDECASVLLQSALVLSIGSGTGLLEELLHAYLKRDSHPTPNDPISIDSWRVEGVEVNPAVNAHLPEDRINHVAGTWAVLESRARDATALMFVYPRDGALVRRYVDAFMRPAGHHESMDEDQQEGGGKYEGGNESEVKRANQVVKRHENRGEDSTETRSTSHKEVHLALWLGPKCDWEDTGFGSFSGSDEFEVLDMLGDVGLAEYEMLAALRRKTITSK